MVQDSGFFSYIKEHIVFVCTICPFAFTYYVAELFSERQFAPHNANEKCEKTGQFIIHRASSRFRFIIKISRYTYICAD